MVAPAFGFSVGDFIAGTQLLITVLNSFKETGGASSRFASEAAFLTSLTSTVGRVNEYVQNTPQTGISEEISKLVGIVNDPLDDFKKLLDKHEGALGKQPTKSGLSKFAPTISWVRKEISGKIEKLRRQVEQPLQAINSLLALQVLRSLESAPKEPLQPAQLLQIVEAIRVADIPTELGKQIGVLQRSAAAHDVRHDHQLQRVEEMRDKFVNELAKLQAAIDEVKDLVSTSAPSQPQIQASNQDGADAHISRLERTIDTHSAELDKALQQQTQLLLALKSFFEDKAVALEKEQDADQAEAEATSWPAATLPTAHLTTVLLSAVVSSVVATATIRQRDEQANRQAFATLPAPSGNNNVYSRTEKAIKASSSEVLLLTVEKKTPKATEHVDEVISSGRASGWVSDFARQNVGGVRSASRRISPPTYSRTTSPPRVTSASPHPSATYVQPDPPQPKRQTSTSSYRSVPSPWGWYDDRDWSKKLSMLDTPDPGYAPPPPSHSHSSFASPTILPGPVMSSPSTPAPASSTPENLMCGICQSPLDRSGICPACGQMQASISIF